MQRMRNEAENDRRYANLKRKYERLKSDYTNIVSEKENMEKELQICRAKLEYVEKVESEFMAATRQTKQTREQYEHAYNELKILRGRYDAEINRLIKQIQQ